VSHVPTVIITRPPHQAQNLVKKLAQMERQTVVYPLFEIEAISDNPELDLAVQNLTTFALVVFVSPNAIDALFARAPALALSWPMTVAIGVVGAASRQALLKYGVDEHKARIFCPTNPERTDSETLLVELDLPALQGAKVLIVRADSGRDFLADALAAVNIEVQSVTAYKRVTPAFDENRRAQLLDFLQGQYDWVITSSAALKTLLDWCSQLDLENAVAKMQQQHLFVPHFRIAEVATELGFKHVSLSASGDEKLLLALQSRL
jgi:uroporphyrinogen-III synthase